MDPSRFREQFPSLVDTTHLASCSQGAVATRVTAALAEFAYLLRDQGAPWGPWMSEVERLRTSIAEFLGASADEIALVPSASHAAYQALGAVRFAEDDVVVSMAAEFPSVGQVLHAGRAGEGQMRWVDEESMREHGVVEAYRARIDERTKLVSVPLALYTNGSLQPVNEIAALAREVGARVLVDAYQATGVVPVDVREIDCDYLVTGTLKYLLGLPGVAALYARAGVEDEQPPTMTGWFGRVDPFEFDPAALDGPAEARRFESGTPGIPAVYAARAGLAVLSEVDPIARWKHVESLVAEASARLTEAGEVLSEPMPDARPGPQVAVVDADPDALGRFLAERRIVTSPRGTILRAAFHYYNTSEDIDAFCAALAEYRRTT
ncbi:aminotransferase class V-fold PLP-dependent enzyme [Amycolatopsis rhabdoformis]|uniref:Aminotransferase class V-fold PLP-dependent enzyme n=1 Tax=Amycolatopsis rhabdoformis TaxID=1448059 RepID=A0ABZ1HYH8_9PSEU|nr:aminotransferase class V-fold PLP-dependent enzyme [Amycolatopsis rhabdoformis]WSE26676.1 aminotransferase class V-fold PLP-dependent enzyme [Amycolatopsis rhabdoformis]